jgi:hypothetical protein
MRYHSSIFRPIAARVLTSIYLAFWVMWSAHFFVMHHHAYDTEATEWSATDAMWHPDEHSDTGEEACHVCQLAPSVSDLPDLLRWEWGPKSWSVHIANFGPIEWIDTESTTFSQPRAPPMVAIC